MRLLHLLEATATGAGRHVMDLIGGSLARGHEVHLLYSPLRCDQVFIDDLTTLDVATGFRSVSLPMRRNPNGDDLFVVRALRRYLHSHGPFDIVHCHGTKAGFLGRLALLNSRVKCLHTSHGFLTMDSSYGPLTRKLVGVVENALANRSAGVIVVSREEYAHAVALGIPRQKLCVIPNGVAPPARADADRFSYRRAWGLRDDELCFGFVGRLAPVKAPETMVAAFAAFRQRSNIPAKLVMVGDGPLAQGLRRSAAKFGITSDVVWLGSSNARPLMCAFDIFCLTSNSEGHPLAVLEAMAQGLPVVATDVGGIRETVQPGVNGFIAPIRGVTEIAGALDELSRDAELRDRMGGASRALSRNFSLDRMVEQTIALYEQLIFGGRRETTSQDLKVAASR